MVYGLLQIHFVFLLSLNQTKCVHLEEGDNRNQHTSKKNRLQNVV